MMNAFNPVSGFAQALPWSSSTMEYLVDRTQRTILFWDVLRKRGNNYLAHLRAGQPPVLVFDYGLVIDGRTFEQPVNYSLIRILDRRTKEDKPVNQTERRLARKTTTADSALPMRPIVIIDPRAGHGPGIGGSKLNSQIGVALDYGHPVYFVMFYTDPEPGQSIADVHAAEIRFLEEVASRHPNAPKPAVIGNCQAGWATALIGADRPDVTGPMVFNGSPLSYWGGVEGANPMRYKGGLCGGVWLTSLWCDLGKGHFDGASLVAGFEDLNPANTYWKKLYHLFSNIDTEENRFLEFEKWWGGFFKMNTEEIHFIVESLFIGNELEQGLLHLDKEKVINLKNFKDPIIVFASGGDNITPPPQALNWIKKVYGSVDEIKGHGQVIVYMVHQKVGHLGIFVSGKVARKEHRGIIGSVDMLEYLSPGLYEMIVEGNSSQPWLDDYDVRFEPRTMKNILDLDDGLKDEEAFFPANTISCINDDMYRIFMSPWVRTVISDTTAETIRQMHPLRIERYALSDLNPFMQPVKLLAETVKAYRQPVSAENPFQAMETVFSEVVQTGLNYYRDMRDLTQEYWFKSLYGAPWMKWLFGPQAQVGQESSAAHKIDKKTRLRRKAWAQMAAVEGGFVEAMVRIFIAVAGANRILDKREFAVTEKIFKANSRLNRPAADHYKVMIKEQARVLELNEKLALEGLAQLLPTQNDRIEAFAIAKQIACADEKLDKREQAMLDRISRILELN
jgi:tellurite resistance protein